MGIKIRILIQVAKGSADVIIVDDNFTTIINVAKWGRVVDINIQKFVQFQLTVNVVALMVNFVSTCITVALGQQDYGYVRCVSINIRASK
ncbi:probable calcium-transporting ATPase 8, plasma membrane-type isoform X2 [Phoenix dactylifera]|uniref:Probable calcium-transporting ATPase 8, plasma membrane-type isoform X2 n=1 Tax=Phoenix dactylifera TaxID=42345 RepID=A0A8B8ZT34_PHODC|nr:probable calcium-transporting ATPase 8, plasma membrane-type isoform X2 [Phoenix dactylifera]